MRLFPALKKLELGKKKNVCVGVCVCRKAFFLRQQTANSELFGKAWGSNKKRAREHELRTACCGLVIGGREGGGGGGGAAGGYNELMLSR